MVRNLNPNLEVLELAVDALGPVAERLVFLGGCATGLLLTDKAAPTVRPSRDIDAITEVAGLGDYYNLCGKLREQGFREDHEDGAPVCRWTGHGVLLDVMPTDPAVLGFGNEWYKPALNSAQEYALPSGTVIKLITAPYFIATKLSAFRDRGEGDFAMSHDLEDVTSVIDGRPELIDEIENSDKLVKTYIRNTFEQLLDNPRFREALVGHLPGDPGSQARLPGLVDRIGAIAELGAD